MPNISETLYFELEFLKNLENLEFRIKNNISVNQYKSIIWYQEMKPFKVVELDKNVGSAIISIDLYNKLKSISYYSLFDGEAKLHPLVVYYFSFRRNLF